ncbi:MAG: sulfatase-like hydrolase/transferase [Burkholderiaceae bacterium]
MNKLPAVLAAVTAAATLAACDSSSNHSAIEPPTASSPNILFVIMDDVGIDQMTSFGYGGATPPRMPNMDAVAAAGLRFRNTWAMPECSPSRAAFFLGQYPLRTNILQAIGPSDLAVSHVSPYATTAPKLLKKANYESGLFGKYHLGGPENNPAINSGPSVLGWDYFYGWVGGLPGSVDSTAGGVGSSGQYTCGYVPSADAGGANFGACYQPDESCTEIHALVGQDPAGLQCLDSGGIFAPRQSCGSRPSSIDFTQLNGYYVSPLVIIEDGHVEEVPLTDPRSRRYRTRIETDAAIEWINSRPADRPWMATVSYSAAHTPWQPPPGDLTPGHGSGVVNDLDCTDFSAGRVVQNRMTEALDTEFGRLLVEIGMATRGQDGSLIYDPAASNTVIVIAGDNGTLATAVKQPFVAGQAKGTTYQTGVWAPLIIAGPQVEQPGREVEHMLNMVDLFQFFGELAGIDVHEETTRTVDSASVLPYLTHPAHPGVRSINFTMAGFNDQANGGSNGPCVINSACTQIPTTKGVCEDNLGVWWGPNYEPDQGVVDNGGVGYKTCGEVNQALYGDGQSMVSILPEFSAAIRDDSYKLVRNTTMHFVPEINDFQEITTEELFEINQAVPVPLLDTPDRNLLLDEAAVPPDIRLVHHRLKQQMDDILASEPACPGDGNLDGVVDGRDLEEWSRIAHAWGKSSVYDFKIDGVFDGLTNTRDADVIQNNLGRTCARSYAIH